MLRVFSDPDVIDMKNEWHMPFRRHGLWLWLIRNNKLVAPGSPILTPKQKYLDSNIKYVYNLALSFSQVRGVKFTFESGNKKQWNIRNFMPSQNHLHFDVMMNFYFGRNVMLLSDAEK